MSRDNSPEHGYSHVQSSPDAQRSLSSSDISRYARPRRRQGSIAWSGSEDASLYTTKKEGMTTWTIVSKVLTFWAFPMCIKGDKLVVQAWREKVSLCIIIFLSCLALGFLTFGMTTIVCRPPPFVYKHRDVVKLNSTSKNKWIVVHGTIYSFPEEYQHDEDQDDNSDSYLQLVGKDVNVFFPYNPTCEEMGYTHKYRCHLHGVDSEQCYNIRRLFSMDMVGPVKWEWDEIDQSNSISAYNGIVLDIRYYLEQIDPQGPYPYGKKVDKILRTSVGGDATIAFTRLDKKTIKCLIESFGVGILDVKSVGCIFTDIVLYISLVVILAVILLKFLLAVFFTCIISRKVFDFEKRKKLIRNVSGSDFELSRDGSRSRIKSRYAVALNKQTPLGHSLSSFPQSDTQTFTVNDLYKITTDFEASQTSMVGSSRTEKVENMSISMEDRSEGNMYVILAVTCYSEDKEGLTTTLSSLAETDYPDDHKLLLVISDGIIMGSGNEKSTPETLVDMIEVDSGAGLVDGKPWSQVYFKAYGSGAAMEDVAFDMEEVKKNPPNPFSAYYNEEKNPALPPAYSYVAIADGRKRHNKARIFCGHYTSGSHRVPIIVIVKCGTEVEALKPKAGNRGKRDSQIVIMSFLSKVLFDDRMTLLEYDLYNKIKYIMKVSPDMFETILFVDADTRVMPNCLNKMVAVFEIDHRVMGLCGETRIENKFQSWVTSIQVFEYFISHHLNKAFESIFGGVTCLPGCFSMYRIKAPKSSAGCWVPVLASPDIVDAYSDNITDTLHKKNLLLLGEDRYLTTLMLKTFPKRKMVFVPSATCRTRVPDTFDVLLSQRRRWINSTIHNLFELVLVPDLCGTFCCSMRFVIFMELVGTLVLPAAIVFTGVLILSSILGDVQYIPLALLAAILGLPAFLILFTARSLSYVFYMVCYLIALPIWNFVLPVYAFWHFDDFSWGETRKVEGESGKDNHGDKEGVFDHSKIYMRRWHEFEKTFL